MNRKNKLIILLLSAFSMQVLSGCSSSDDQITASNAKDISIDTDGQNNSTDDIILDHTDDNEKHLTVDSRCRGCGRCVNIDPAHFDFNNNTGKAIVASQDNLDSKNLKRAISICPTNSISI